MDGPEEFYVVLLDNGRTKLLRERGKRQSLYCIRCGACLNHCPVYRKIGGHSYPVGLLGTDRRDHHAAVSWASTHDPWLPFASSLCGACAEVCPVKIDIPKVLLDLRADVVATKSSPVEKLAFRMWAAVMSRPTLYRAATAAACVTGSKEKRWIGNSAGMFSFGPIKAWLSQRDLPAPAPKPFRQLWKDRH